MSPRLNDLGEAARGEPTEAKLYRIEGLGYLFTIMTAFFTVFGLAWLLPEALRNGGEENFFASIWLAFLGWFWFNLLNCPHEVRVEADGRVVFRSVRRRP